MRVAYILPSLANRGPIIFTKYLINAIKPLVDDITVFYFKGREEIALGVNCIKINVFRKIDIEAYDIIHTTMLKADLYASFFVSPEKWISSMHNYFIEDTLMLYGRLKGRLLLFIWKYALYKCANIIISSNAMKNYYVKHIGMKNYVVIPYGIQNQSYSSIYEEDVVKIKKLKEKKLFILGSVGLLVFRKGFHQLLEVLKDEKDLALILIGEGAERKRLERLINLYYLEDRVIILGFRANSFNYYVHFDAYAHVSYSEGFGLAMLEAMAKKLPVICSKLDIYSEYFSDKDVSYFVPDDLNSLKFAIHNVMQNRDFFSKNVFLIYKKCFSSNIMAREHLAYYKTIPVGIEQK